MTWLEKKRFNCFFFFLQETKKEDISKELCFFIWGGGSRSEVGDVSFFKSSWGIVMLME